MIESRMAAERVETLVGITEADAPVLSVDLMEQIVERGNLFAALRQVQSNGGSPGIDKMSVEMLPEYLKKYWPEIRFQLLSGTYHPLPVRRVAIPKPQGGLRLLGIPCVVDRLIQQAILQVLQRQWDPLFSEMSFGFRPNRSAHQAVTVAQQYLRNGDIHL